MDGDVNITTIGWYISPLLNATIRTGCTKEKRDMFEALIGVKRNNEYKTKGVVEIHSLQKTMARICGNVKARQDREVKASVVTINEKIKNEKLDSNKILFIDVTEMLDNSYTGLVAGKIAEQYKRPVILLQSKKDKEDSFGGSGRNYHNFTVKDLQSYLLSTGYFDKCAGHDNAFGVEIKKDKVPSCVSHINTDLRDVEIDDYYTVDYEIPMNKLTERIVKDEIGRASCRERV